MGLHVVMRSVNYFSHNIILIFNAIDNYTDVIIIMDTILQFSAPM